MNKSVLLFLSCLLLVAVAGCGSSTVIVPNGYLYSANTFRPGSMAAFSVTTGSLLQIADSPFVTTGNAPYTIAAWPPPQPSPAAAVTTQFLYAGIPATSKGGVITRLLGHTLTGSVTGGILLMPINSDHTLGTPQLFASGGDYDPIAVTPPSSAVNALYAINLTTNDLVAFSISSSNGALTAIGPAGGLQVGPDAFNVVVDPQGKFVYVANCDCVTNPQNLGSVSVFSINSDGTLTAVPNSPFQLGGANTARPVALAVSPDSMHLFVASLAPAPGTADEVYVESIAANGALSDAVPGVPSVDLPIGSSPVSIAVSTDGNYVYTGNAGNDTISFFLNCLQTTLPMGCPDPNNPNAPLAVPANNSSTPASGAVVVVLADPTNPPACTSTTAVNCSSTSVSGFLYTTDYDHGSIQAYSITSTDGCTDITTCIPGELTASGSAVNTGGQNPFGLAIAH
ncbi:MAG: beta-propeller fold lactonase family protein [Terriglobales bacterium]